MDSPNCSARSTACNALTAFYTHFFQNWCESVSRLVMSDSLPPHELQPIRLLYPWNSPGKNTTVGCYSLLQGIFLIQGSNLGPHTADRFFTVWAISSQTLSLLNQLSFCTTPCCHFLYGVFPTQDWTQVSCIAGGFFTMEPPGKPRDHLYFLSPVQLFATPWTAAHQAPLSMGVPLTSPNKALLIDNYKCLFICT